MKLVLLHARAGTDARSGPLCGHQGRFRTTTREEQISCPSCRMHLGLPVRRCVECGQGTLSSRRSLCPKCLREHDRTQIKQWKARVAGTLTQHFKRIKRSAETRGIPFDLQVGDVEHLFGSPCVYCGSPLAGLHLDRRDNNEGYTPPNVVSCCPRCNTWKGGLSVEEFLAHAQLISRLTSQA